MLKLLRFGSWQFIELKVGLKGLMEVVEILKEVEFAD